MKKLVYLVFVIISIASIAGCKNNKGNLTEVSVRLPIPVADGAFAPYYVAQDKGIFEKHGLNVTLEAGSAELNPIKMVDLGKNKFGILGGPELLMTGISKGAKITGIGLLHKNSDFVVILTKKNSKYKTLQELNGQKVGFNIAHISTDVLRSLFIKENIKVEEVDVGFNYNLFIADRIPAQWAFRTTAALTLPTKGVELNIISPADYGIKTHGHTLIVNNQFLKDESDVVENFLKAIIEATEFSLNNIDETVMITCKRDKSLTEDIVRKQLAFYNKTILSNEKILWIDENCLKETKERLINLGLIENSFSITNIIDNSFLKKIYTVK
jgi:NitT/TauT family transport system substrate-binding protein